MMSIMDAENIGKVKAAIQNEIDAQVKFYLDNLA